MCCEQKGKWGYTSTEHLGGKKVTQKPAVKALMTGPYMSAYVEEERQICPKGARVFLP